MNQYIPNVWNVMERVSGCVWERLAPIENYLNRRVMDETSDDVMNKVKIKIEVASGSQLMENHQVRDNIERDY